jgi:hypothetical protein
MKQSLFILAIAAIAFSSCKKKSDNTVTTPAPTYIAPVYVIDGVRDVNITANSTNGSIVDMPITVEFKDSFQKQVTLSLSDLPDGIAMDENWIKTGYPTFSTSFTFYDTAATHAAVGSYPMTLTATGPAGTKTYTFNLKVLPEVSCSSFLLGVYSGNGSCGTAYSDTVYADATIANKIWFKNFGKTGKLVYGLLSCIDGSLKIPNQAISGFNYSGSGYASGTIANSTISVNFTYGANTCSFSISR